MGTPNDCEKYAFELAEVLKSNLLPRSQMGRGEETSPRLRGNSECNERHRGRAPLELRRRRSWERGVSPSVWTLQFFPNIKILKKLDSESREAGRRIFDKSRSLAQNNWAKENFSLTRKNSQLHIQ